jgi:hypothetical protein
MARSKIGKSQIANSKKSSTPVVGRAAQARAAAKKPQKGSSANPVQRMGLGSIYDKITVDNTSLGGTPATSGSGGGSSSRSSGRSYSGGGGGYSGPSAADLAAQAAALEAARRQAIVNQYVTPTNTLYDEAKNAAQSDATRSNGAFDAARNEVLKYGAQVNAQALKDQDARRKAYGTAMARMGLSDETALRDSTRARAANTPRSITGTSEVVGRNAAFVDAKRKSLNEMYVTQRGNGQGRVKAYQNELDRQRQLQLQQIAKTYGITL